MSNFKKQVLFLMSGSIASYKACYLISKLVQNNFKVQVVASASALKFVGQATLEGLTGNPVVSETFETGHAMSHIHLIRDADLVLLCPATANTINKMAQGVGDDLLTTLFLAHDFKKPFLLAPAMNTTMYVHPVTQASLKTLSAYGVQILETASGVLACGENGWGKLLDPELIFKEIEIALGKKTPTNSEKEISKTHAKPPRVILTSGGTSEIIDSVRFMTNRSTGQTGALIAETLYDLGCEVVYLAGESAALPDRQIRTIKFFSHKDLERSLFKELEESEFDYAIQAAAVSDFSVKENQFENSKMSSESEVTLKLKLNTKIIDSIKSKSKNKSIKLVGFKLTSGLNEKQIETKVNKLISSSKADLVISNDLAEFNWGDKSEGKHLFHLWTQNGKIDKTAHNKTELSAMISEWIVQTKGLNI